MHTHRILSLQYFYFPKKYLERNSFHKYIHFTKCKKKKWDENVIKTRVGNFESTEHDVTISNGKQYNNFSYCFYFLLLWLRICIILFLSYTVYSTAARIKRCIFRRTLTDAAKIFFRRIHSRANVALTIYRKYISNCIRKL